MTDPTDTLTADQARQARADYHRDYMRRRRNSARCGPARAYVKGGDPDAQARAAAARTRAKPERDPWLAKLRLLYPPFLRAQRDANAYRDDTLRLTGVTPTLPAHIQAELDGHERALDRHAARDPERAAEYFERHALADSLRALHRLEREDVALTKPPRRGRPRTLPAVTRVELVDREARTRAARVAAYAAHTAALDGPALPPARAEQLQARWHVTQRAHERAADALAEHDRTAAARAAAAEAAARAAADRREQIDALRADIDARTAALPDPPRAPLHPRAPTPDERNAATAAAQAKRAATRAARAQPAPITSERYTELTARYALSVDHRTGAACVVRRATGQRLRAATVACPSTGRRVRVSDLLDAMRPCGLV